MSICFWQDSLSCLSCILIFVEPSQQMQRNLLHCLLFAMSFKDHPWKWNFCLCGSRCICSNITWSDVVQLLRNCAWRRDTCRIPHKLAREKGRCVWTQTPISWSRLQHDQVCFQRRLQNSLFGTRGDTCLLRNFAIHPSSFAPTQHHQLGLGGGGGCLQGWPTNNNTERTWQRDNTLLFHQSYLNGPFSG